jgi:hypothetical protein
MSTIAVFLVLGGATAFAATELGKNTVGSKQIKSNAVTAGKIKKEAITGGKIKNGAVSGGKIAAGAITTDKLGTAAVNGEKLAGAAVSEDKIANNAVTGAKVKDGSLTGTDINQASLTSVKAANVYATEFDESAGALVNPSDPGIKSGGCFIACIVEFPRNVTTCSETASAIRLSSSDTLEPAFIDVSPASDPNSLIVVALNKSGTIIAHDFGITVVCPSAT